MKDKEIEKIRIKGVGKYAFVSTRDDKEFFDYIEELDKKDPLSQDFNNRKHMYEEVRKERPRGLGPKFEHIKTVYEGGYMQIFNFQFNKTKGGMIKKFVIKNIARTKKVNDVDELLNNEDIWNDEEY